MIKELKLGEGEVEAPFPNVKTLRVFLGKGSSYLGKLYLKD